MTGKGILEALSFVDEAYIEEAETGTFRRRIPIVKVLLPLAACLCVAVLGLFPRAETETAMSGVNLQDAVMQEPQQENVVYETAENSLYGEADIALDEEVKPHASEVPSIILRITEWTEGGFTATVERHVDSEPFPLVETVQVEFLPGACIEVYEGELVTVTRRIPTQDDFPVGSLVQIQYLYISDETWVIYADAISLPEVD